MSDTKPLFCGVCERTEAELDSLMQLGTMGHICPECLEDVYQLAQPLLSLQYSIRTSFSPFGVPKVEASLKLPGTTKVIELANYRKPKN